MGNVYAKTMFGEASRSEQQLHGSRAAYERLAALGESNDSLTASERTFIEERDSFYIASVTADGWPYMQHRGGPPGFLRVLDGRSAAFADFAGNKQYITVGNLATDQRVSLFLMDYVTQSRLKLIARASVVELGIDPALEAAVSLPGYAAKLERVIVLKIVAFDWNCSQHIQQRWTAAEWKTAAGQGS